MQGWPLLPFLFNVELVVLASAIEQEKLKMGIQTRKGKIKLFLLEGDIIVYVEKPNASTKNTLRTNK